MPRNPPNTDVPVPRWLMIVASVAICWHLGSILVGVLAAPSGPWPSGDGGTIITRPKFALTLHDFMSKDYLHKIRLKSNYHYPSNFGGMSAVYVEIKLKDDKKQEIDVVRLPDLQANFWVSHRQNMLAGALGQDENVTPPNEAIPAPGQAVQTVVVWQEAQPGRLRLQTTAVHLVPRDQPVARPSDLAMILARAYARHLCRSHGAASAEVLRTHQNPIPPLVLSEALQSDMFSKIVSEYGEFPK